MEAAALICAVGLVAWAGLGSLGGGMGEAIATRGEVARGVPRAVRVSSPSVVVAAQAGTGSIVRSLVPPVLRDGVAAEKALGAIPWKQIDVRHFDAIASSVEARVNSQVAQVLATPGARTFDNTVRPLADAFYNVDYAMGILGQRESMGGSERFSKGYAKLQERFDQQRSRVLAQDDLRDALAEVHASLLNADVNSPQRALTERYLSEAGFPVGERALPKALRERAARLREAISQDELLYERNQAKAYKAFEVVIEDRAALRGLSDEDIREARRNAKRAKVKGYLFRYDSGGTDSAARHLKRSETRKVFWEALHRIAADGAIDNRPVVERLLANKRELAEIYGYPSYAEFAMRERGPARRMLGSAAEAEAFVDDMIERVRPLAERELDEVRAYRFAKEGISDIEPWDETYWFAKLYEKKFAGIDESKYLALDHVIEGAFTVSTRLFGVNFEEVSLPAWHKDVRSYRVTDADGRFLGHIHMDLLSRRGKDPGSWQSDVLVGEGRAPSSVVIGSDIERTGKKAKTRLDMDETENLFHEVGHALHVLLTEADIREFGGTSVAQDFGEFPSQLMENWAWEKESLQLFARHKRTGKPMPTKFVERLIEGRRFGAATDFLDSLVFAKMDLGLHHHYRPAPGATAESFAADIARAHGVVGPGDRETLLTDFDHLFAGEYAAGYHGYAWGRVQEADVFEEFRRVGLFDADLGARLRNDVLSQGAMVPASDLYRRFMGRDPSPDALLRRLGE